MPRIPRGRQAGSVYHVINRGNGRATILHKAQDYQAFLSILALAKARHPVKMFGFSLMPNHFHFVIEASHHQSLSRFMQWLLTSHVRRYHKHYASAGMYGRADLKVFRRSATNICSWCSATFCRIQLDQAWQRQ
jgi:putative transposase